MSVDLTVPQSLLASAAAILAAPDAPACLFLTGCHEPSKKHAGAARALHFVPAKKGWVRASFDGCAVPASDCSYFAPSLFSCYSVTASDLTSSLPSGIRLLGCIAPSSSSFDSAVALNGLTDFFILRPDGTAERFTSGKSSPANVVQLTPSEVASAGELCALHGAYVVSFLGESAEAIASQLDQLSQDTPKRAVWQVEPTAAVAKSAANAIIQDESAELAEETVASWLAEDNPLTLRRKAQTKLDASSASSAASAQISSAVATASLPEYAVEISLLLRSSPFSTSSALIPVPTLAYERCQPLQVQATFSVLHYATGEEKLGDAICKVRSALVEQIEHSASLLRSSKLDSRSLSLRALHFHPQDISHALSSVFLGPTEEEGNATKKGEDAPYKWMAPPADGPHPNAVVPSHEVSLTPQRQHLQHMWNVPEDRPAFRVSNAISFSCAPMRDDPLQFITQPRLFNVHEALPRVSATGGQLSMVQGRYAYYHYMQDRMNDSGWGCAYRTLQTICSWYILQGYTHLRLPIPTHREIQQILVAVGDKESRFVDSKDWIGSTEVGLVLDYAYGVTTKTLFISSGSEVSSHGRALQSHFRTQGTPIMIGGGVLAYGLLGVDFNENTGECRFLILDPHYTGADTLASILKGGWVGWKKADLFLADHFYNFAMPQRMKSCV